MLLLSLIKKKYLFLFLVLLTVPLKAQVVINEVMVNPSGGNVGGCVINPVTGGTQNMARSDNQSCGSEYVELYNSIYSLPKPTKPWTLEPDREGFAITSFKTI
jgi:hypothetical protein